MKTDDTELKVFISTRESTCSECGEDLGSHAWITLSREKGALCLTCADLDHLAFLPPRRCGIDPEGKEELRPIRGCPEMVPGA